MSIEIKEITTYAVTYNGKTEHFDNYHDASKYAEECEHKEREVYMDSLGIPHKGLYIVKTKRPYPSGRGYWCVLMYDRMCVAEFIYGNDGKLTYGRATKWTDDHISGVRIDDILANRKVYEEIWNSKNYVQTNTAFRVHWGNASDWSYMFDYAMHPEHTADGVEVIPIEQYNAE